jgi:hypothetical protein
MVGAKVGGSAAPVVSTNDADATASAPAIAATETNLFIERPLAPGPRARRWLINIGS